jgi:AsmA protein
MALKNLKSKVFKWGKRFFIVIFVFLALLFILPKLFSKTIENKVKEFANAKINGELNFGETQLSFFTHFPSLTLTLEDFWLKGSQPFEKDTLLSVKEVSFGINVASVLFGEKIKIEEIYISEGKANIKVSKQGYPNYNIYKSDTQTTESDTSSTSIQLDRIDIRKLDLTYSDLSTKIEIKALGFDYLGKGNLHESLFNLKTKAQIEAFDFTFDSENYLKNKKVNANLVTKVNTNSLELFFDENKLMINKLPVDFKGKLDFLKNGYNLDFTVQSQNSSLENFFTALPPQFVTWLEHTQVKGKTDLYFSLKGKYIAEKSLKPDIHFNMKVREGYISNKNAPIAASHIFLNFDTQLPALDVEQIGVKIDSVFFNVGQDYFNGNIKLKGFSKPKLDARVRSQLNLAQLDEALGLKNLTLKGIFKADITSRGSYDKALGQFPVTKGGFSLKDGFIQTQFYPNPIKNIQVAAKLSNSNGNFADSKLFLEPLSFVFEDKPFVANASFQNFDDVLYDINAKGILNIEKIYKVFNKEGLNVTGFADVDVSFKGKQSDATSGKFQNLKNTGRLDLKKIKINSDILPLPFVIEEGQFVFNQDRMHFDAFTASYGQSDFKMNGYMNNVINFMLSDSEILNGNFSVTSRFLNCNEFLIPTTIENEEEPVVENGVMLLPQKFNFNFNGDFAKIKLDETLIENLKGKVQINKGQLQLINTSLSIAGAKLVSNVIYAPENSNKAHFDFSVKASDFDIKRAYNEIPLFKEMASAAAYAEGIVALDYKLSGKLGADMSPIYPSLTGGGVLSVKNIKMKGFKIFNVVSQKTETDALQDPELSKVSIRTTVKNNIIKIERFRFKVAGFRPRIEGETSFNGDLNVKMRLGLPPLGILGIPIKITGTQENPKIGIGRKSEDLKEIEYEEPAPNGDLEIKKEVLPKTQKDTVG